MKKEYFQPDLAFIQFRKNNLICTSVSGNGDDYNGWNARERNSIVSEDEED